MEDGLARVVLAAHELVDPFDVARLIRDAIVERAGFDRCGVWLLIEGLFCGSWGTDARGRIRDERGNRLPREELRDDHRRLLDSGRASILVPGLSHVVEPDGDVLTDGRAIDVGVLALRARGKPVGIVSVDNWTHRRRITQDRLDELVPFCDGVAIALANATARAELEQMVALRGRWMELSAAVSASLELDSILKTARDGIASVSNFDRVGVFRVDHGLVHGSWGTDRKGRPRSEHDISMPLSAWPVDLEPLASGRQQYIIADWRPVSNFDASIDRLVRHAVVGLHTSDDLVGFVCVDNLMSGRPIVASSIEPLLAFASLMAIAIRNARLFDELSRTQQALVASERLRAVGELASGVAHNVNNLLTAVLGYSQLIQRHPDVPSTVVRYAQVIERAALDGAEVVRRMQQFSRRDAAGTPRPIDAARAMREAVDIARSAWHDIAAARGARIEIIDEMPSNLTAVGIDSELREVFVNLLKNAVDAMPGGGWIRLTGVAHADHVVVAVADNGLGMDDETRRRVFEPFFTTKPTGIGTGLGLAVAWGIIARFGGDIEVRSAPGMGTTFRVRLRPAVEASASLPVEGARLHGLWVLLVEDEETVAEGLASLLRMDGARVSVTRSGAAALRWLGRYAARCHVVVSDHGMIGITGAQLLARVREQYPSVRRVLLSGWGGHSPDSADLSAAELVIGKPVRREALSSALHSLCRVSSAT